MTKSRRMLIGGALAFVMVTSTIAAPADSFISSVVSTQASAAWDDIFKGNISDCTIKFSSGDNNFKYTGKLIKPKLRIKTSDGKKTLKEGTDYTLSYDNNLDYGKGTVTITGKGDFYGTDRKSFYIVPSLDTPTLSKPEMTEKSGKGTIKGTVKVPSGYKNLELGVTFDNFALNLTGGSLKGVRISSDVGTTTNLTEAVPTALIAGVEGKTIHYTITGITPGTRYKVFARGCVLDNSNKYIYSEESSITVATSEFYNLNRAEASEIAEQRFTGKEVKPSFKVTIEDGNSTITIPKECYTVTYKNNVEPGIATAIVKPSGKGKFKLEGKLTVQFSIANGAFPKVSTSESKGDVRYTWKNTCDSPVVMVVKNSDGMVTFANLGKRATSANLPERELKKYPEGTYTVLFYYVNGIGDPDAPSTAKGIVYEWIDNSSIFANFGSKGVKLFGAGTPTRLKLEVEGDEDNKYSITADNVSLTEDSFVYTGKAVKPYVTVKNFLGLNTLKQGTDYTVSYKNNTKIGEGTVIVKGKGKYTGSVSIPFDITPADILFARVAPIKDQTYTGKTIMPTLNITYEGKKLVKGVDYVVDNGSNTNPGTGTVYINGKGNFKGSQKVTFKIVKAQEKITSVTVDRTSLKEELTNFSEAQRSGRRYAVCPKVTVKAGKKVLRMGTDYTLGFSSNESVGTAKVTITGKGDYTGTKTVSFKISITKPKMTDAKISVDESALRREVEKVKNGETKKVTAKVTVTYRGTTLREGKDYTVSCSRNSRKGTVKVTVKGKGNYTGTKSLTFKM